MKIAIHTVARNEQANVAQWMQSGQDADYVVMVDTGSTDGTLDEFRMAATINKHWGKARATYIEHRITVRPWRFDVARNAALSLIPADVDVVITMDMDERIQPGWREAVEKVWQPGVTTSGSYRYIFARHPDGSVALEYWHNRIHTRDNFHWVLPAHEAPYPYLLGRPESKVAIPGMVIEQQQNLSVNRAERDLPLVELGYKENPHSQRALFYLGRQYLYAGRYDEAIDHMTRYFAMGKTFAWEASAAADVLAQAWRAKG